MIQKKLFVKLLLLSIFLLIIGAIFPKGEKVPVTTNSKEAKEYFIKARDLNERLRGQEAKQYFTKAIEADPKFAVAYLNRAFTQTTAEDFFKDINKAVALSNKASKGEQLQIHAAEAAVNANPKKQREYLLELVKLYPEDERAHNLLATHYFGQQEDEKAIEEYKKCVKINPDFSPPYNQMGYAYRRMGNYDKAENSFKKYIELIPDDPNPYDSYAELQLKRGNFEESIEYYKKALSVNPDFAASRYGLAANYIYMEDYSGARRVLEKFYDIAKNDGQRRTALFGITCTYIDEGKMDEALKQLEKQYKIAEKNNDYAAMSGDIFNMATINYETGKYDKALDQYKKSVELFDMSSADPSLKENARLGLLYNEAAVAMKKKDFKTAEMKSEQFMDGVSALENQNQIRLAHELEGMLSLEQRNVSDCMQHLKQANSQNPLNHYRMALASEMQGDKAKAKELCMEAKNFNGLPNINTSLARYKAKQKLTEL